jgi:tetratricopeptide (TPR) repeat protein
MASLFDLDAFVGGRRADVFESLHCPQAHSVLRSLNLVLVEEHAMGIFERYTKKAIRTIILAKHEADGFGSLEVCAEHILLALLSDPVLISSTMEGVSEPEVRAAIRAHLPRRKQNPLPHDLPLNTEAHTALVLAREEANKLGQTYVQNEHIMLALLQSDSSYAAQILTERGLSADKLRLHTRTLPQPKEALRPANESKEPGAEVELIQAVFELVNRGEGQKALRLLDDFMGERGQDRALRVRSMGGFAAIIALQIGDLKAARRYCEECLTYASDDAMALYRLTDCLARQGETDEARRRAAECHIAASSRGDERGKRIVELVERRFPELKRGTAEL